jgi:serine beta-lactamase-like protein LACTB, mitochondrial
MRRILTLLVLSLAGAIAQAQQNFSQLDISRVRDVVQKTMVEHHIPGASAGVVMNGAMVWGQGFGVSDVETGVPAAEATEYRLGSISKPISAVAAMTLVEQHKLDLDVPVQKYCPAFPQKQWPVTMRELLSHTAGIRHYRDDESTVWAENTKHFDSMNDALSVFANDPLKFQPGTQFGYSTYGYTVVGCAIEGASGKKFMDYLQEAVLSRAGMTHTVQDNLLQIIPNRTRYYDQQDGRIINAGLMDSSYKIPGGGLLSDVNDISAFMVAMMQHKVVSQQTVDLMWTPVKTSDEKTSGYGLGFGTGELHGLKTIAHTGGQKGTSTIMFMVPEKQFGVVILTNLEGQGDALRDAVTKIADELVGATPSTR